MDQKLQRLIILSIRNQLNIPKTMKHHQPLKMRKVWFKTFPKFIGFEFTEQVYFILSLEHDKESHKPPSMPPPTGATRYMISVPQLFPVLNALVEKDRQEVHLMPMPRGKPTLYKRLTTRKLLQPDQPPPYTQRQVEGQYYFKAPGQRGENTPGAYEAAPDVCQFIFNPDEPTLSTSVPTEDDGETYPSSGVGAAPESQMPTETAAPKNRHANGHW